ncbi:Aec78 [Escherichia coli]|nr:Aec78 [Escherichia coli]
MSAGPAHFRLVTKNNVKSLTTETALDILIAWLQDNIDCESGIIFDNDEDKTDSAALLPCIEQAREDVRTLRQLQFLQQNR